MKFYMVFESRNELVGVHYGPPETRPRSLTWVPQPVGVFQADSPDKACAAAARKRDEVGTYFAIEGHPWGVLLDPLEDVAELGYDDLYTNADDQIEAGAEDEPSEEELEPVAQLD